MFAKAQMQIFGDPDTMAQMSRAVHASRQPRHGGRRADANPAPPSGQELLEKVAGVVATSLQPKDIPAGNRDGGSDSEISPSGETGPRRW